MDEKMKSFEIPMNEKMKSFEEAVKPIQKWFRENCCPHDKVIVDWGMARLFEGVMGVASEQTKIEKLNEPNK